MDGILCLDKPENFTSFDCCAVVRRLLGERKIGHAGTLDPMATGVLPLMAGKATRAIPLLPVHDKRYTAVLRFGFTSDTLDQWGTVRPTGQAVPSLSAIEGALPVFRGHIQQIPPMMSALKKDGVRLYDLARRGIQIEREPRPVTIYKLDIFEYNQQKGELQLDCSCSQGTYIRTLCDDLGRVLGCGAVMTALRRTEAAGYGLKDCLSLEQLRDLAGQGQLAQKLLPVESAFYSYPAIRVTSAQATRFRNGGSLDLNRLQAPVSGITRIQDPEGNFLGLGTPQEGQLKVLRTF